MIINFDMPRSVEEYIHQVGRTGRLGSKGTAISFINNVSKKLFLELVKMLKPLGVSLPPELANSPFLHLQQEQHQSKKHGRTTQTNPMCEGRAVYVTNWEKSYKRKHKG